MSHPIKVTLEFGTQEELLAFFGGAKAVAAATPKASPTPKPQVSAQTAEPVATAAPAPAPVAAPVAQPDTKDAESAMATAADAPAIDYPTLQKKVFELAALDKSKATGIAGKLGVASFKELPATRYAEALKAVETAIAEHTATAEVA